MVLGATGTWGFPGCLAPNVIESQRGPDRAAEGPLRGPRCLGPHPRWPAAWFGKSLWHTDLLSLRDLCFLTQDAFRIVCDSRASTPELFNSCGMWRVGMRHWTGGPWHVGSLLSWRGHRPTWSCKNGTQVPCRRACSFWWELTSDLTAVLSAEITWETINGQLPNCMGLWSFFSPFLSLSLSFYDTKTEKPSPLNNSHFDLQKTTNISSEQRKHVFSCIWVQEHRVFPFRSFKVHQVEGWSNRLSRQKECSLSTRFYSIIIPPLNAHRLFI